MFKSSLLRDVLDADAIEKWRGPFRAHSGKRHENAVRSLAEEVIARLEMAHREHAANTEHPLPQELDALCHALLRGDPEGATTFLLQAHADGVPVEDLSLRYLGGAARQLGLWWEEDRVSAAEVVLAAGLIYGILRSLHRLFDNDARSLRPDRFRAMFASPPGETHTLGVTMAADHFRRLGWDIVLRTHCEHEDLVAEAGRGGYNVIGLSASTSSMIFPLARLTVGLRLSRPGVWIMICGPILDQEPDVCHLVDADAAVNDLSVAEGMMTDHLGPDRRALN